MALTKNQMAWAKKLAALLANAPEGVELVMRPGRADVVPAGFEDRVLNECDLHLSAQLIEDASIMTMSVDMRIVPISEAI